ncbi:hypothetical protein ACFVVX_09090 [Kitasatospora sp. NPDC058170]|uniref:hypothetical protein n=1 Tax=Kitasatospora sp. NPDC058170 TaxID=3346364 RepID=UPI0036D93509
MVTFSQLQHIDLASLNSAAADFETMVRSWDLSTKMQNEVIGPVQQSGWHGPSSEPALASLTRTRDQIHAAFEEASAIARTLREAHDEFAAAKKDLQTAVQHATGKGLTVDGEGGVHWPPATDPADKKDPDYAKGQQSNAQATADEIGKAPDRALEAAATGRAYDDEKGELPPHTKEMGAVMQQTVHKFGDKDAAGLLYGDDALFGELNGRLAHMTGAYMGDVQHAVDGSTTRLPVSGVPTELGKEDVQRLVITLGRNPDAYASIATAQQAYTTAAIDDVIAHRADHGDLTAAIQNVSRPGGEITGLLTSAMVDEVYNKHAATDAEYNEAVDSKREWAGTIWETTGGKALEERAPVAGPMVNEVVNQIMDGVADSYHVDHSAASNEALETFNKAVAGAQGSVEDAVRDAAGRSTSAPEPRPSSLTTPTSSWSTAAPPTVRTRGRSARCWSAVVRCPVTATPRRSGRPTSTWLSASPRPRSTPRAAAPAYG